MTDTGLPLRAASQSGAALVVSLVFLMALTLLGVAAVSGNTLQQRMTYSVAETNLAFQAAESAVATGENWLEMQVRPPVADCPATAPAACWNSLSIWPGRPASGSSEVRTSNLVLPAWWQRHGRPVGFRYAQGAAAIEIAGQRYRVAGEMPAIDDARYPRYVIEDLGQDPAASLVLGRPRVFTLRFYRITGHGRGAQQAAHAPSTITQSVYSKGF